MAVYAIFFAVQFFFNFETFSNLRLQNQYISLSHHHHPQTRIADKKPFSPSSKPSIRLNKRFQQADMALCEISYVPAPVQYAGVKEPIPYRNALFASHSPLTQPLRGPPFAACS